jgi:hypothetical protein
MILLLVEVSYENVKRPRYKNTPLAPPRKKKNFILEFRPCDDQVTFVAALRLRLSAPGQNGLAFIRRERR